MRGLNGKPISEVLSELEKTENTATILAEAKGEDSMLDVKYIVAKFKNNSATGGFENCTNLPKQLYGVQLQRTKDGKNIWLVSAGDKPFVLQIAGNEKVIKEIINKDYKEITDDTITWR